MIINLKNSKNLSTNDLRNSYQVQWWYIHEFYTDSLSFAVLSLVNSSLEQTHRDNIAYYLGSQYISYLEKYALWVRISFLWRFTKKNNNYQSCLVCHEAITLLKCKKNYLHQFPLIFGHCTQNDYQRNYSGQYQKPYNNSYNNSTVTIYSKWAKSRCAILFIKGIILVKIGIKNW